MISTVGKPTKASVMPCEIWIPRKYESTIKGNTNGASRSILRTGSLSVKARPPAMKSNPEIIAYQFKGHRKVNKTHYLTKEPVDDGKNGHPAGLASVIRNCEYGERNAKVAAMNAYVQFIVNQSDA